MHSPFVYDLVTKCFYNKQDYPEYAVLRDYRKNLLESNDTLEVTDYGAGSRVFKSNTRSIAAIARNAGISKKRQQLLFRLARYFKPALSLELGTSLGLATVALSIGNTHGRVITLEGCPNTAAKAQELFSEFQLEKIQLKTTTFETFFENPSIGYDLVFIDGNHDKTNTLSYFDLLRKSAHNDTVLIFDDIYWSPEMTEAWNEIIAHPEVTVSIDTYQWGLVFFRKEQEKEHFRIRV
ncbi:MAG: class I SAM-dependent methyltransferase [Bacteroidota bacterium]